MLAHDIDSADVRLVAIADMLMDAERAASTFSDALAFDLCCIAADVFAIAHGFDGALDVPRRARVPMRMRSCIRRAAGDDAATIVPMKEAAPCR